jgi:hypothetical protein
MENLEAVTFSELIDKLITIYVKLFNVLDRSSYLDSLEKTEEVKNEIVNLSGENIRLIKQRSFLKSSIDKKLNDAIKNGGTQVLDEVKKYNK